MPFPIACRLSIGCWTTTSTPPPLWRPGWRTVPAPALRAPPAAFPALAGADQALAWARAERLNLLACLDHVTHAGQHARVVALTAAMAAVLRQDGPWADALTRHAIAVEAARHVG